MPDPKRAERAMAAMLQMRKLDIAALRSAADGADRRCRSMTRSWRCQPGWRAVRDPDPKRAERAMAALLKMRKLDIAALRSAADATDTANA